MNNKIWLWVINLFYPNRCACCGDFIGYADFVCENCFEVLENLKIYGPVSRGDERHIAAFFYKDKAKDGVISLKGGALLNFARLCAENLSEQIALNADGKTYDCIVPVPMSKNQLSDRGGNHAEAFAKILAKKLRLPLRNDVLKKKNGAPQQHTLNAEQRKFYLEYYEANNVDLNGKNIILIDDIITTGSTMKRCCRLLKSRGAVSVLCAAATATKFNG